MREKVKSILIIILLILSLILIVAQCSEKRMLFLPESRVEANSNYADTAYKNYQFPLKDK